MPRSAPAVLVLASLLTCPARAETPPPSQEALAASRVHHDPAVDFTPISRGLGLADISCTAKPGQFDEVELLIVTREDNAAKEEKRFIPMRKVAPAADGSERFEARVMTRLPVAKYTIWGNKTAGDLTASIPSQPFEVPISPKIETPDWAKGAVWYQIFPERFRNANPANDPNGSGVFLAPWNSSWYNVQPGEMDARTDREGRDPDRRRRGGGDLYKVIFDRRYGGDLQGVVQKLDYLKETGVTAIYLNPIFQARSLHKYDASDYRHIDSALAGAGASAPIDKTYYTPPQGETGDPKTWTWTSADRYFVDVFLPEVHKRGIRVILDGVWNHTGREFWAFEDVKKNGRASAYADWYNAQFDAEGKLVGWSGWEARNGYLPEFRQVKGPAAGRDWDATVEKGDLNAGVKEHIFAVTKRWMDPNGDGDPSDGIDGWRLDVVPDVGLEFWRSWRTHVKAINPNAILVCEVWFDADEFMKGDSFDTQMHYPFAFPVLEWLVNATGKGEPLSSARLAAALGPAFDNAPATNLIHQNLFASHDTDRYVSMLFNPGRPYDQRNSVQNGDDQKFGYKVGRPDEHAYRISRLGVAIQATYLGAPMVFYGDEIGMWGADDPTCRKPMPWPDAGTPENHDDAPVPGLREDYAGWLGLRAKSGVGDVLRFGSVRHLESGNAELFAFERELNGQRVVVLVNRGEKAASLAAMKDSSGGPIGVGPLEAAAWFTDGTGDDAWTKVR